MSNRAKLWSKSRVPGCKQSRAWERISEGTPEALASHSVSLPSPTAAPQGSCLSMRGTPVPHTVPGTQEMSHKYLVNGRGRNHEHHKTCLGKPRTSPRCWPHLRSCTTRPAHSCAPPAGQALPQGFPRCGQRAVKTIGAQLTPEKNWKWQTVTRANNSFTNFLLAVRCEYMQFTHACLRVLGYNIKDSLKP